jgi:hypothetical protein
LNLWHKIHAITLVEILGCYWLKITDERILKREHTPLQKVKSFGELSLKPQKVSEVEQALVMVKVFLQKFHEALNVHSGLNLLEFSLKHFVFH